ncbi:methyltransferase-like protein 9 [Galendromus occidentalis]|uniref:Methyltransferase-like protein 9 n=1 Tax=Galendromus occidentalis TaxID=34638 RepID=A0AAJ6QUL6_9ACAR|nr:methyltransferase-like protein 9 [Galendromus occidentalis]
MKLHDRLVSVLSSVIVVFIACAFVLMGTEKQVRPYIHTPIARAVYERLMKEREFEEIDRDEWYRLNLDAILSEDVRSKFIQMKWDVDTQKFVDQSSEKSSWIGTQLWHALVTFVAGWKASKTSLNGWLNRGSMFVFSESQFLRLTGWKEDHRSDSLLDLGAGDGNVTARFSRFFGEVFVTEVSSVMRKVLVSRGYQLKDVGQWDSEDDPQKYSMISALNLLDRCDAPISLLKQIPKKLAKNGFVLIALVLPLNQYVENNAPTFAPSEIIGVRGRTTEEQVDSLVECVLEPLGYKLKSWTRLPYLCEGDLHQPYYWMHDIVLLLQHESAMIDEA